MSSGANRKSLYCSSIIFSSFSSSLLLSWFWIRSDVIQPISYIIWKQKIQGSTVHYFSDLSFGNCMVKTRPAFWYWWYLNISGGNFGERFYDLCEEVDQQKMDIISNITEEKSSWFCFLLSSNTKFFANHKKDHFFASY